jgi:hypothetical protein
MTYILDKIGEAGRIGLVAGLGIILILLVRLLT